MKRFFLSHYEDQDYIFQRKTRYLLILCIVWLLMGSISLFGAHIQLEPALRKTFLIIGDLVGIIGVSIAVVLITHGKAIRAAWLFIAALLMMITFHNVLGDIFSTATLDYTRAEEATLSGIVFIFSLTLFAFNFSQMLVGTVAMIAVLLGNIAVLAYSNYDMGIQGEPLAHFIGSLIILVLAGLIAVGVFRMNDEALNIVAKNNLELEKLVMRRTEELRNAKEYAEQLARTDMLSGLHNRRSFFELAEQEFLRCLRYGRPLSMIMLDIDQFKQVNDSLGHHAGDEAIRVVSSLLVTSSRATDIIGRLGGEEFVILLPETGEDETMALAERLREKVAGMAINYEKDWFYLTVSLGVAQLTPVEEKVDDLLVRADKALYRAKKAGKDRVVLDDRTDA
ncbi:MAG: diguanylate cyclase [Anaerolineaceae bacterium]|nr:diguanylate cyclase [Anaerolineaceae bacterium]